MWAWEVLNLRVTFDELLTTRNHVDNVVRSCFFHHHQLRSVRRSLTDEALYTLVHAFIASRVDYCNALLYGVADGVIRQLQLVVHAAAQLITGIRRYEHITPTLRDTLHWLPTSQRITFKTALMMFDCSRGRCPKYFGDVYTPVHTVAVRSRLRSADHGDIVVPRARSTRFDCRVFACADQQFGTHSHRICKAQTLENSLGYLSVRTAGSASDRRWLNARRINGLTYLLTYFNVVADVINIELDLRLHNGGYMRAKGTIAFPWYDEIFFITTIGIMKNIHEGKQLLLPFLLLFWICHWFVLLL